MSKTNTIRLLSVVFGIMFAVTTDAAARPREGISAIELLQGIIAEKDATIAELRVTNEDMRRKIQDLQSQIEQRNATIAELRNYLKDRDKAVSDLTKFAQDRQQEHEEFNKSNQSNLEEHGKALEALTAENCRLQAELNRTNQTLGIYIQAIIGFRHALDEARAMPRLFFYFGTIVMRPPGHGSEAGVHLEVSPDLAIRISEGRLGPNELRELNRAGRRAMNEGPSDTESDPGSSDVG